MTKPSGRPIDFLIIGAAKCATTWEQQSLSASPGIFMPAPELHFFSRVYDRGFDWYRDQFASAASTDLIGEKSNSYLTEPAAAQRIKDAYPDARLIVQMRNPVQRAYSDYCMLFRRGEVSGDIDRHLNPDRAGQERFLHDGRYAHHLDRFYALFPADQILLLAFENVATDPTRQLALVADHIGYGGVLSAPLREKVKDKEAPVVPRGLRKVLAPLRPILDPIRESTPMKALRNAVARPVSYPALTPDLERKMTDYFRDDVDKLRAVAPDVVARWDQQFGSDSKG
ncbi:sulfotransferase [uncultured Aliiroseovarius sp.]|uniref:sulfotransferase family protein n=1 Tax=uncultured Aliiroseovarius sp. TaxID=1658783 RepID=UPI002608C18A|nr:sulfotransferase [uncultured Aliiroseovarius sp.]